MSPPRRNDVSLHNKRRVSRLDDSFQKYSPEVVARPVDTFVRHQVPLNTGADSYGELAAALARFSPSLNAHLKKRQDEQREREEARGVQLYHESGNRMSWEDWRKSQPTLPGLNENVKSGYLKARMANEANIFRESLHNAYFSGEATVTLPDGRVVSAPESDDPATFNLWLSRFTKQYIQENLGEDADPEYFAKVFAPGVEQSGEQLASTHISRRNAVLESRSVSEHAKLMTTTLEALSDPETGLVDVASPDAFAVSGRLSALARSMAASGLSQQAIQKAVLGALVVASRNPNLENGEELFDLAPDIQLAPGVSLWDDPGAAMALITAATDLQRDRYFEKQRHQDEEREREKEERRAAENTIADYALSGRQIPPELKTELRHKYGVDALSNLYSSLRGIAHGYKKESSGGGGGGGGGSATAKKISKALKDNINLRILLGQNFSIQSVVEDTTLTDGDKYSIVSNLKKETAATRTARQTLHNSADKVIEAELHGPDLGLYDEGKGKVQFLQDNARNAYRREVSTLLDDPAVYNELRENPDALIPKIQDIARKHAIEVRKNKDILINHGYELGGGASDPLLLENAKQRAGKKTINDKQTSTSDAAASAIADEYKARGLDPAALVFQH